MDTKNGHFKAAVIEISIQSLIPNKIVTLTMVFTICCHNATMLTIEAPPDQDFIYFSGIPNRRESNNGRLRQNKSRDNLDYVIYVKENKAVNTNQRL